MIGLNFKSVLKRGKLSVPAMLALALSGCGGSDSTGGPQAPTPARTPTPAPVQSKVVFVSDRDGNFEIYSMNADGSGQKRLTNNAGVDIQPDISADGSKIVFVSERNGKRGLYTMSLVGSAQPLLIQTLESSAQVGISISPSFSRNGQKIVFADSTSVASKSEIYVIDADGRGRRQVTSNQVLDHDPVFSPDGSKIAFVSKRSGDSDYGVHIMNADGSAQRRLTDGRDYDANPDFSPDGQSIVFTSGRSSGARDSGHGDIYSMKADGSGQQLLTNPTLTNGTAYRPSFGRFSQRIFFVARGDIYSVNASGGDFKRLTNNAATDASPSAQ